MLLVILGHAIQSTMGAECESNHLWNIIYSFHMPAFMAISGWLAFRKTEGLSLNKYWTLCKRRACQLLVPYFVWTFVSYFIKGDFSIQVLCRYLVYPDLSFWFLWVLFWICVIFSLAQLVASKLKVNEMIMILGTCLLLIGVMVVMEIRVLGFQFLSYYFLFYTLGYCLHKFETSAIVKTTCNTYIIVAMTILWFFLAWGWTMHGLPSWMPAIPYVPSSLLQYAYRGITALAAIVVLIGVAPKLLNSTSRMNQMRCSLGVISLGLYVVHLSLIGHIVKVVMPVMPNISIWCCVAIAFAVSLGISYLFVWLLYKNRYTACLFLGKV